ncbi:TniQ family protein [Streptomyces sp. NPDC051162]|uniref:TniQ family protein n=1 Tax=Streptomyces sp. NPDC051162 TaxID=3154747 RepID=UPI003436ED8D
MSRPRTLAIRLLPQPGESIDSWLEALARRSWTSLSSLLDALGLPTPERTSSLFTGLPAPLLRLLEEQLALPTGHLDQTVFSPGLFSHRSAPHWRFCPTCLHQSQGRSPIRWWLPWTFACTAHHTLLHSLCPRCLKPPREFLPRPVHLHPPGHCMRRSAQRTVCGADLTTAPPIPLAPPHPVLETQKALDVIYVDRHSGPDSVFTAVEKELAQRAHSLPDDLEAMSSAARDVWSHILRSATSAATEFGAWRIKKVGQEILTHDFLRQEYGESGRPLHEIADSLSVPRAFVIQRAKDLGVTIYRGSRPIALDDEWLKDQYINRVRSAEDIGAEAGVCGGVVLRRLEQLDIPRRPFGVQSSTELNRKLDESVPRDIRAAVEGTLGGWLRLRRFQIHMQFPTLLGTAHYLGVAPGRLAMQFGRLEEAIGAELFHRSVRHEPQRPTARGTSLLNDLDNPHIRQLMHNALGPQIETLPDQASIDAAVALADGERAALTALDPHTPPPTHLRIPPPILPLLQYLVEHANQATYSAQIHARTDISFTTIYKQLKCFEEAGWLTSRRETAHERRPRGGRGRTYYTLSPTARRLPLRNLIDDPGKLRKWTAAWDEGADTTMGQRLELAGQTTPRGRG